MAAAPALSLLRDDTLDYRRIERDARIAALESAGVPIPVGQRVAWSMSRGMQGTHTDDFSLVHRAGATTEPTDAGQRALCGERIGHAIRRMPLSSRVVVALGVCRYCEEAYATLATTHSGDSDV